MCSEYNESNVSLLKENQLLLQPIKMEKTAIQKVLSVQEPSTKKKQIENFFSDLDG